MVELTQARLKELLSYDPETGLFTWNQSRGRVSAGTRAGTVSTKGYNIITIDLKKLRCARLAFLYMTGSFPQNDADHRNTIRTDDRWLNLRDATSSQNGANKNPSKRNKTGVKGVDLSHGKFRASINFRGKFKHLGLFEKLEDTAEAFRKASNDNHGEFARVA